MWNLFQCIDNFMTWFLSLNGRLFIIHNFLYALCPKWKIMTWTMPPMVNIPPNIKNSHNPIEMFYNCSLNTVQTCHLNIKYTCTYVFSSHALIIQFNNAQDSNILKIEIYFFGSNIWLLHTKKWQLSPMVSLFLLAATLVSTITHELCLFCRKNHP